MHSEFRIRKCKEILVRGKYPFHIDNPECIVQGPYFVRFSISEITKYGPTVRI